MRLLTHKRPSSVESVIPTRTRDDTIPLVTANDEIPLVTEEDEGIPLVMADSGSDESSPETVPRDITPPKHKALLPLRGTSFTNVTMESVTASAEAENTNDGRSAPNPPFISLLRGVVPIVTIGSSSRRRRRRQREKTIQKNAKDFRWDPLAAHGAAFLENVQQKLTRARCY